MAERGDVRTVAMVVGTIAGSATVVRQGESVDADRPTIAATAEVADQIPARTRRTLRLFGVTECLHLWRTTHGPG